MKSRAAIILVVLLFGLTLWFTSTRRKGPVLQSSSNVASPSKPLHRHADSTPPAPEGTPEAPEETSNTNSTLAGPVISAPKRVLLAALEEPPTAPEPDDTRPVPAPATALENMRVAFRQYAMRFGGNPVGNNREITAALNGQNPRQVVFVNPDDGMHINPHGELVDNWGTPYFFHQLSATEMEIHSAGPDHKMWTSDDLVIK